MGPAATCAIGLWPPRNPYFGGSARPFMEVEARTALTPVVLSVSKARPGQIRTALTDRIPLGQARFRPYHNYSRQARRAMLARYAIVQVTA